MKNKPTRRQVIGYAIAFSPIVAFLVFMGIVMPQVVIGLFIAAVAMGIIFGGVWIAGN